MRRALWLCGLKRNVRDGWQRGCVAMRWLAERPRGYAMAGREVAWLYAPTHSPTAVYHFLLPFRAACSGKLRVCSCCVDCCAYWVKKVGCSESQPRQLQLSNNINPESTMKSYNVKLKHCDPDARRKQFVRYLIRLHILLLVGSTHTRHTTHQSSFPGLSDPTFASS